VALRQVIVDSSADIYLICIKYDLDSIQCIKVHQFKQNQNIWLHFTMVFVMWMQYSKPPSPSNKNEAYISNLQTDYSMNDPCIIISATRFESLATYVVIQSYHFLEI